MNYKVMELILGLNFETTSSLPFFETHSESKSLKLLFTQTLSLILLNI